MIWSVAVGLWLGRTWGTGTAWAPLGAAGAELRSQLAPDLPTIWADPVQIGQVLTNLIVNAQQALADRPEPRRLVVATRFDAVANMAEVAISDNGPGIPPDMRTRIFEPFFTTKPLGVGTGIGLSVCHSVVASHDGTVVVDDAPGGGASFIVRLPLGKPEPHQSERVAGLVTVAPGGRLLIVDDEPEVAATLAEILSRDGYAIDIVNDGATAMEKIHSGEYDLILSDIRMPGINGMELYRRLRDDCAALADRLIFVTGDALSASVQEFLAEQARPRIEKPFIPADVRMIVATAIARNGPPTPA